MKLLIVHNSYQQPGGEDQVVRSELELLRSHGHEVILYAAHNDAVRRFSKLNIGVRTIWSRSTYRDLRAVLQRERPHVVHVHNTLPLLSPAVYYAAAAERVPVVQTLHNYRLLCPSAVLLRGRRVCEDCVGRRVPWPGVVHACYRQSRAATSAIAVMLSVHRVLGTWTTRVNRYIALTEFMRQKFIEGGFAAKQMVVKPNFVAPDPGAGAHGGRYALFVGRLSPEKGLKTLLEAWGRMGGRVRLRIAGDGPLRRLAFGSPPCVEWLGRLPQADVLAQLKEASLLIFPSEWYEGFPTTIAQAFAVGLPVVASRLGAMAEIVAEGENGLLFTPGDSSDLATKVEWALGHSDESAAMGRRARTEFEAKYTAERNYNLLRGIYQAVLKEACAPERSPMMRVDSSSPQRTPPPCAQPVTTARRCGNGRRD